MKKSTLVVKNDIHSILLVLIRASLHRFAGQNRVFLVEANIRASCSNLWDKNCVGSTLLRKHLVRKSYLLREI